MPYKLPEDWYPVDTICVQIEIPDNLEWIFAFKGQLQELGKYWTFEKDDTKTGAAIVADRWRQALDTLVYDCTGKCTDECCKDDCGCEEDCMALALRPNPTNPCILEASCDGGVNWYEVFNSAACIAGLRVGPTGQLQFQDPTDSTWRDGPSAPHQNTFLPSDVPDGFPELAVGPTKACIVASGIAEFIRYIIQQIVSFYGSGLVLGLEVWETNMRLFGHHDPSTTRQFFAGRANALFGLSPAVVQAALDAIDIHALKCAIYCDIEGDGYLIDTPLPPAWINPFAASPAGDALRDIYEDIKAEVGMFGLQKWAYLLADQDADCDLCDCGLVEIPLQGNLLEIGPFRDTISTQPGESPFKTSSVNYTLLPGDTLRAVKMRIIETTGMTVEPPDNVTYAQCTGGAGNALFGAPYTNLSVLSWDTWGTPGTWVDGIQRSAVDNLNLVYGESVRRRADGYIGQSSPGAVCGFTIACTSSNMSCQYTVEWYLLVERAP